MSYLRPSAESAPQKILLGHQLLMVRKARCGSREPELGATGARQRPLHMWLPLLLRPSSPSGDKLKCPQARNEPAEGAGQQPLKRALLCLPRWSSPLLLSGPPENLDKSELSWFGLQPRQWDLYMLPR